MGEPALEAFRVLHLSTELGFRGGEQQVLNLMRGLAHRGVAQGLLAPRESALVEAVRQCADLASVRVFEGRRQNRGGWRAVLELGNAAKGLRPSLLHAHTSRAHSTARLAQTFAIVQQPIIVTRRVDFPLKSGFGNTWKYLRGSVRFIAISEAVRTELIRGGVPPQRIQLARSGIDPDRFGGWRGSVRSWNTEVLKRLGLNPDHGALWICVAALADHKDHPTLLAAMARLRQEGLGIQLALAGEGDQRSALERIVQQNGLESVVHFLGRVDTPQLAALHRAPTGFVLTSKLEGLGTAVLDAMAAGVPVVATAAGGIPEAVLDGETGWLCPVGDDEAVARGMAEVTAADTDGNSQGKAAAEVRRRTENALAHVMGNFTYQSTVEGTLAAYNQAMSGEPGL